jgi:hypothetical protein
MGKFEPVLSMSQQDVDAWNRANVTVRAVTVTLDSGEIIKTATRSDATMLGGHTAVIWLKGIKGCYALSRVQPYHGQDGTDCDYWRASGECVCEDCGKKFYDHPDYLECLGKDDVPFLKVLCDGRLVKL